LYFTDLLQSTQAELPPCTETGKKTFEWSIDHRSSKKSHRLLKTLTEGHKQNRTLNPSVVARIFNPFQTLNETYATLKK